MNPIVVCLCIFPTFVIFILVSEGSETHVIMTEIKHVFVCLWDNVCVCPFLPPPQRNCASTGYKKLRQQFYDCHPVSERRTLPVDSPHVASENHYGRAKLWMAEGTQSSACLSNWISMLLTLCLSAGDWNTFLCSRGIMRFKTFYIKNQKISYMKTLSYVLQNLLEKHVQY